VRVFLYKDVKTLFFLVKAMLIGKFQQKTQKRLLA